MYAWGIKLKTTAIRNPQSRCLTRCRKIRKTRQLVGDLILSEALRIKQAGDPDTAAALFMALGDHPGAQENYDATRYEMAIQQMTLGEYRQAAESFAALGTYEDSPQKLADCLYEAYERYFNTAEAAYEAEDWQGVVDALDGYDMTDLPGDYQEMQEWYEEACYLAGGGAL